MVSLKYLRFYAAQKSVIKPIGRNFVTHFYESKIIHKNNSTIESMAIEVGQLAPDFTLFSDEKKQVSLSDYRGKNVVINFFPAAYTGVCTAQLCDARDNMKKYESLNAQVLGISVDSPFTLAKFESDNNGKS